MLLSESEESYSLQSPIGQLVMSAYLTESSPKVTDKHLVCKLIYIDCLSSPVVTQTPQTRDMQRPHISSGTGPTFHCPNPLCDDVFLSHDLVCSHLTVPDSDCSRWAMELIDTIHYKDSADFDNTEDQDEIYDGETLHF